MMDDIKTLKTLVKNALANAENDLYRASKSFHKDELDKLYGQSGRTRREILDNYQKESNKYKRCLELIDTWNNTHSASSASVEDE